MKRKVFGSRLLAGILTLAMVFTLMPTSFVSLAAPADEEITVIAEEGEEEATTEEAGEEIEAGEADADEVSSFANAAEEDAENGTVQASDGEDTQEEEAGEAAGLGQAAANETAGGADPEPASEPTSPVAVNANLLDAIKSDIWPANSEHHQKDGDNVNTVIDVDLMGMISGTNASISGYETLTDHVALATLNITEKDVPSHTAGHGNDGFWVGAYFPKTIAGYTVTYKQGGYVKDGTGTESIGALKTSLSASNGVSTYFNSSCTAPDAVGWNAFTLNGRTYGKTGNAYDAVYFNAGSSDNTHKIVVGSYVKSGTTETEYVVFDIPFGTLKTNGNIKTSDKALPKVYTIHSENSVPKSAKNDSVSSLTIKGDDLLGRVSSQTPRTSHEISLIKNTTSGSEAGGTLSLNANFIDMATDGKTVTATAAEGYFITKLEVKETGVENAVGTYQNIGKKTATATFTPDAGATYTVAAEAHRTTIATPVKARATTSEVEDSALDNGIDVKFTSGFSGTSVEGGTVANNSNWDGNSVNFTVSAKSAGDYKIKNYGTVKAYVITGTGDTATTKEVAVSGSNGTYSITAASLDPSGSTDDRVLKIECTAETEVDHHTGEFAVVDKTVTGSESKHATIKIENLDSDKTISLGTAESGTVEFTVTPDADYLIQDSNVKVYSGTKGQASSASTEVSSVTRASDEENWAFASRKDATTYSFTAEKDKSYKIEATATEQAHIGAVEFGKIPSAAYEKEAAGLPQGVSLYVNGSLVELDAAGKPKTAFYLEPTVAASTSSTGNTNTIRVENANGNIVITNIMVGGTNLAATSSGNSITKGTQNESVAGADHEFNVLNYATSLNDGKFNIYITYKNAEGAVQLTEGTLTEDQKKAWTGNSGVYRTQSWNLAWAGSNTESLGTVAWTITDPDGATISPADLGLKGEKSNETTYTLSGTPKNLIKEGTYTITAEAETGLGKKTVSKTFTYAVKGREAEINRNNDGTGKEILATQNTVDEDGVLVPTGAGKTLSHGLRIEFANKDSGYSVSDLKKTIVLTKDATGAGSEAFEMTGIAVSSSDFVLEGDTTTALATGETRTLTVYPKSGLPAGTYEADVVLSSNYITGAVKNTDGTITPGTVVIAKLFFTVNESYTVYVNGKEVEPAGNGTDSAGSSLHAIASSGFTAVNYGNVKNYGDIDLGTFPAGTTLSAILNDGITVKVTGSNSQPAWAGLGTNKVSLDPKLTNALNAEGVDRDELVLYGTIPADAYTLTTETITVNSDSVPLVGEYTANTGAQTIAKDTTNKETIYYIDLPFANDGDVVGVYTGVLRVTSAETGYSVGSEAVSISGNAGSYSWAAAAKNAEKVVTIENLGDSPLSLKYTLGASGVFTVDGTDSTAAQNFRLAANGSNGSTRSLTIGLKNGTGTSSFLTTTLKIEPQTASTQMDAVTLTLSYTKVDGLTITSPAAVSTEKNGLTPDKAIAIPVNAKLGETDYNFRFEAEGGEGDALWYIEEAYIGGTSSDKNYKDAEKIAGECGLSLSETSGLLSGTPKIKGTVLLYVKAIDSTNDAAEPVQKWFALTIGAAADALTARTSSGTSLDEENGLSEALTSDGREIKETIIITNGSSLALSGLSAAVATKADGTGNGTNAAGSGKNITAVLGSNSIASGKSEAVTLTIPSNPTKAFDGYVVVKDGNGDVLLAIPLSCSYAKTPVITSASITNVEASTNFKMNTKVASTIRFQALDSSGNSLTSGAAWSWAAAEGSSLPEGLELNETTGAITGTPAAAGKYKVIVTVTDTAKNEYGSADVEITVNGVTTISVQAGTTTLSGKTYVLAGGIQNNTAPDGVDVSITNNSGTTALSDLTVTIEDGEGVDAVTGEKLYTGNASYFTLSTGSISSIKARGFEKISVSPNYTGTAGTFMAKVTIDGAQIVPVSFNVRYTVTKELVATQPLISDLTGGVGDKLSYAFIASGAGTEIDEGKAVDSFGQAVKWEIVEDSATEMNTTYNNLKNLGITTISTTGSTSREITGGKLTAASGLLKAGSVDFTVQASVSAVEQAADATNGILEQGNYVAAQVSTIPVTLTVTKSGKAYVTSPVVATTSGAPSETAAIGTSSSKQLKAFSFHEIASGYASAVTQSFTVTNSTGIDATLTASIVDENETKKITVSPTTAQKIRNDGTGSFTVSVAKGLAVGEYPAKLVLKGDQTEDLEIDLLITVAEPKYEMSFLNADGTSALESINLDPSVKNGTSAEEKLVILNNGNVDAKITAVAEVKDAEGTSWGTDTSTKKLNTSFAWKDASLDEETGKVVAGTTARTVPITLNRKGYVQGTITLSSSALRTTGEGTAYLKISYQSGTNTTASRIVEVHYNVLNNAVADVTIDPSGTTTIGTVSEGYKPADYVQSFTLTNALSGTAADPVNTLSNVSIKLDGANKSYFDLDVADGEEVTEGAEYTMESLAEGESLSFTVKPVEGLQASDASYRAYVVYSADNLAEKRVAVLFKVNASDEAKIAVSTSGIDVTGSFATRLERTLDALDGVTGSNVAAKVSASGKETYNIDVNGSGKNDVAVEVSTSGTVAKKLSTCDLGSFENGNTLSYANGVAGTTFKSITFQIYEEVVVDVTDSAVRLMKDEKKVTWADYYKTGTLTPTGKVEYLIPYGETIQEAKGSVIGKTSSDSAETIKTITGLPTGIVNADGTIGFESWFDDGSKNDFAETTPIRKDYSSISIKWHTHEFAPTATTYEGVNKETGKAPDGMAWTWNAETKTASLLLTCLSDPTHTKELKDKDVTVTEKTVTRTDTRDGGTEYEIVATDPDTGVKYVDIRNAGTEAKYGHKWDLANAKAVLSADKKTAKVTVTCLNTTTHMIDPDGPFTQEYDGTVVEKSRTQESCDKDAVVVYTVTFKDNNDAEWSFETTETIPADGHQWGDAVFTWAADYSSAKAVFTCSVDKVTEEVTAVVTVSEPDENGRITYTATATTSDGKKTSTAVQYSYKAMEGVTYKAPSNKDWTFADDGSSASVTLKDSAGNTLVVTTNDVMVSTSGNKTIYTATIKVGNQSFSGKAEKDAESGKIVPISLSDAPTWNLFDDVEAREYSAGEISGSGKNTNKKSVEYFDAELNGNVITVALKSGADRKKAAKTNIFEFATEDGAVTVTVPMAYVKPSLKLTSTSGTIVPTENETDQVTLNTTLTYKDAAGLFVPMEITDEDVSYVASKGSAKVSAGNGEGVINIDANEAASGKIKVQKSTWAEAIQLSYSVKASKKNFITLGAKQVVLNISGEDAKAMTYEIPVYFNGAAAGDEVSVSGKKATDLVTYDGNGTITVAATESTAAGTYSYTVADTATSKIKATFKVKVSNKALTSAISAKVQRKYDIVTGQSMLIVPTLKEISGTVDQVKLENMEGFEASLNDVGNVEITYSGEKALGQNDLKTKYNPTLTFTVKGTSGSADCAVTLKNVKLQKTNPTVKANKVTVTGTNELAVANIISTYKDKAGIMQNITPVGMTFTPKNCTVEAWDENDPTTVNIKIPATTKSASVKAVVTYPGGVTKNVTISVSRKN